MQGVLGPVQFIDDVNSQIFIDIHSDPLDGNSGHRRLGLSQFLDNNMSRFPDARSACGQAEDASAALPDVEKPKMQRRSVFSLQQV